MLRGEDLHAGEHGVAGIEPGADPRGEGVEATPAGIERVAHAEVGQRDGNVRRIKIRVRRSAHLVDEALRRPHAEMEQSFLDGGLAAPAFGRRLARVLAGRDREDDGRRRRGRRRGRLPARRHDEEGQRCDGDESTHLSSSDGAPGV